MKSVIFHSLAESELYDSAYYYEKQRQGLGQEFIDDVQQTIEQITAYPHTGHLITKELRQKALQRFPFNIIYRIENETIFILVIMHQRRRPNYWMGRA